ncbi:RNA polymerase factor sigma-54 [Virgibacillus halophilus]|uniref:RNA polymerase factor sigma-54 n=1 Tax=Tigheibacillus halophilus TaxID=361280 RepID=A0ABU5C9H1_9BACI|nr:RNA polymerase factor sigma-54 [Virgibacillus halophilus]
MQPRLIQEQSLQWKMNQSLLQAIQILQFSSVELLDYIKEVANENPLVDEIDTNYNVYSELGGSGSQPDIGEINSAELSMFERLKRQLFTLNMPEEMLPVVIYGIDSLDESGYLTIDLQTWANDLQISPETALEALSLLQSLDPPGIGARTLTECILLQLQKTAGINNLAAAADLLHNHLDWVADNDLRAITNAYDVDEKQAADLIEHIRACHPKPGNLLADKKADYIIPEAAIIKEDGRWKISFYKWSKPTISLNHDYENLAGLKEEDKTYLKEKKQQIEWLNNAIDYRISTLEKIIHFVVQKQLLYFEEGTEALRPLTLKEAAGELDISISTVSRSIQNKYVQTTQGVTPIKFFFCTWD